MKVDDFLRAVECLTGSKLKQVSQADKDCLRDLLANDDARIDCSQFNELLLLVNKDRLELPFFLYFFTQKCRVKGIAAAVSRFQQAAMLRYGNFIWAYRTLSRIKERSALMLELGEFGLQPNAELKRLKSRRSKLLEIDSVDREQTVLLGYLSSVDIAADKERSEFLKRVEAVLGPKATLGSLRSAVAKFARPDARADLLGLVAKFARIRNTNSMERFRDFLDESAVRIEANRATLESVQSRGRRNQEIYLTWDHMDIYFATSMRKPWEFRDLYDFIKQLMSTRRLKQLKLRHFDPTQSFTPHRINKGLLEALMLKRAKCTVYSVQDADTLGKDSELAATLAQGKPVVAYVPEVHVQKRSIELSKEEPTTILERLKFVLYADESFSRNVSSADYEFVRGLDEEKLADSRIWRSVPDSDATSEIRRRFRQEIRRLCDIIASAEKRIYDVRAGTLRQFHPLALQVNLDTGVANGVLVVREVEQCSRLLWNIVTRTMDFELEEDGDLWYLRERISNCVYRVVTKDRKLSNCFWNFYLR